jgi:hypothetical protein
MSKLKCQVNVNPPSSPKSCEKIGLVVLHVIPAKAGIQCFDIVTNTLDPGFHRGDEYSAIFLHLPFRKGG